MTYLGQRVEVFWPPEGDDAEGTWYRGELDRYDDIGGTGYHVTYDDGDEEVLGMTIEGRDDVRLLPADEDVLSPSEVRSSPPPLSDQRQHRQIESEISASHVENATGEDSFEVQQGIESTALPADEEEGGGEERQNSAGLPYREIERPASPPSDDVGSGGSEEEDGKGSWERSPARTPASGRLGGDPQSSRHIDNGGGDPGRAQTAAGEENAPERPSTYRPGGASCSSDYNSEESDDLSFDADSSDGVDEAEMFGREYGASDRGSYRGTYSDDGYGSEVRGSEDGEEGSFIGIGGSVKNLSLSPNSSEWTPLRGADFLAPSSRQDQPEDWLYQSSQHEKASPATRPKGIAATTEACISALRHAVDAAAATASSSSAARGEAGSRCVEPPGTGVSLSPGYRAVGWGGKGATVPENAVAGGRREGGGLTALGRLVHDTALLEGAVDGVEGLGTAASNGEAARAFVKVSFIDGGGGGGLASTTNAMFRCKTLLHTTGSGPAGRDGGGSGGWPSGDFQCETFHGGRLGELADAAVLFSAHRALEARGKGPSARGLDREGLLGQVILPLSGLLHNLRPVVEPSGAPGPAQPPPGDEALGKKSTAGVHHHHRTNNNKGSTTNRSSNRTSISSSSNDGVRKNGGTTSENNDCGVWRSLRGEVRGEFPVADRRGRTSEDAGAAEKEAPLRMRLRLSVSLSMKAPESLTGSGGTQRRTLCAHVGTAATAPCATVGETLREDAPPHTGLAVEKKNRTSSHYPVEHGGRKHQGAAAAATRGVKKKGGGNGGGGGGGGGLKSPRSASLHHGAALARQRRKRQQEIARENERMERRLKIIREANPGHHADAGRHSREQRRRRRCRPLAGGSHNPANGGREEAWRPGSGGGGDAERRHGAGANTSVNYGNNTAVESREAGWRELYRGREALASAVEKTAAGVAETRAEVEALRAKTLCTEANARSASMAVASLERTREARGEGLDGRQRAGVVRLLANAAVGGSGGGVFPPVVLDGLVEPGLASELSRKEELYKALVEARRSVVKAGEESRLKREADLKELEELRARLADAEVLREGPQRQHRGESRTATGGLTGARSDRDSKPDGDHLDHGARDRAWKLLLSLRVEVETLRLVFGNAARGGAREEEGAVATSRAVQEAQEEVTSLKARLESKTRRLEAASFDRDAVRAEYQNWVSSGQRSALKESIAWLEHAALHLAKA